MVPVPFEGAVHGMVTVDFSLPETCVTEPCIQIKHLLAASQDL